MLTYAELALIGFAVMLFVIFKVTGLL